MALLELCGVNKTYAARHGLMSRRPVREKEMMRGRSIALSDINFQVSKGGTLGVVGESGAGKTTIARIVAGLTLPDSGSISWDGVETVPSNNLPDWARHVQLVWQNATASLDPRMKLGRAITEPLRIHGTPAGDSDEMLRQIMHEVELSHELAGRFPHELSGGQIQRAVIARALAMDPDLLILDEPASALDARVKRRIIDLLKRLRSERGVALVIITHDIGMAALLADAVVILQSGEIVEQGETMQLLAAPGHPFTREMIRAIPRFRRGDQSPM